VSRERQICQQPWMSPFQLLGMKTAYIIPISKSKTPDPLELLENWTTQVNQPLHETDLEAVEKSLERGRPLGSAGWTLKVAARLELEHTMRPQGRPKNQKSGKCENELRPRFMSQIMYSNLHFIHQSGSYPTPTTMWCHLSTAILRHRHKPTNNAFYFLCWHKTLI
jgi:hypothetical protein